MQIVLFASHNLSDISLSLIRVAIERVVPFSHCVDGGQYRVLHNNRDSVGQKIPMKLITTTGRKINSLFKSMHDTAHRWHDGKHIHLFRVDFVSIIQRGSYEIVRNILSEYAVLVPVSFDLEEACVKPAIVIYRKIDVFFY